MDTGQLFITLTGTSLVLVALLVELEHQIIWKHYRRHYHPHKNKYIDALIKPYPWVYALNVYILWPLVFVMGLYILIRQGQ